MATICLTYAQSDAPTAAEIAELLTLAGHHLHHHVYPDPAAPWTGASFTRALHDATHWLILLSATAIPAASLPGRVEAATTPATVAVVAINPPTPITLNTLPPGTHFADLRTDPYAGYSALLAAVRTTPAQLRHTYEAALAQEPDAPWPQRLLKPSHFDVARQVTAPLTARKSQVDAGRRQLAERQRTLTAEIELLRTLQEHDAPLLYEKRLLPALRRHTGLLDLPPALYADLRTTLAACDEFATNRDLRALFANPRLRLWQQNLPEAPSRAARVDRLVDYLQDKQAATLESALVILLDLLAGRYADSLHDRLHDLARRLQAERRTQLLDQLQEENRTLLRQERLLLEESGALSNLQLHLVEAAMEADGQELEEHRHRAAQWDAFLKEQQQHSDQLLSRIFKKDEDDGE